MAIAFLDAEDLGQHRRQGVRAGRGVACRVTRRQGCASEEVLILDMVGGKDMVLDIDAHILHHPPSRALTTEVFRLGMSQGWQPFAGTRRTG